MLHVFLAFGADSVTLPTVKEVSRVLPCPGPVGEMLLGQEFSRLRPGVLWPWRHLLLLAFKMSLRSVRSSVSSGRGAER